MSVRAQVLRLALALAAVALAALACTAALDFDKLPRYLRVNYDIGGTVSPGYTVAIAAQSLTN